MTGVYQDSFDAAQHADKLSSNVKKTEVTVDVYGVKKVLMKFELRPNGDVIHIIKHAEFFRELEINSSFEKEIKQQRYSFHQSLNSPNEINVIKQTYEINNGEMENTLLVTPVIKNKSGFAQVYSRRVPNLTPVRYNSKALSNATKEESLGCWEVKRSTLFLSVFVGAASLSFSHSDKFLNICSFVKGGFRFVLVWSYLSIPAPSTGALSHRVTIKLSDDTVAGVDDGLNMEGVVSQSLEAFWYLADEFSKDLSSQLGIPFDDIFELFKMGGFIKDARRHSQECNEQLDRIYFSGLGDRFCQLLELFGK